MILAIGYITLCSILYTLFRIGKKKAVIKNQTSKGTKYNSTQISVIIPFRNEENNIPNLIRSIKNLNKLPLEFIWVNDHSTDQSVSILKEQINGFNHIVLHLPKDLIGKKNALIYGITNAKGEYILTWDADITLQANFFNSLESYPISSLGVLPVEMKPAVQSTSFFATEFHFLNQINISIYGWFRPIIANGANLLIDKAAFNQIQPYQENLAVASGDDQFLLKQFNKQKQSISVISDQNLFATTYTPSSIKKCLEQRIRWATKTNKVNDKTANLIGILGLIYHFIPILFIFFSLETFLIVMVLKIIFDFLIQEQKIRFNNISNIILFSIFYPIYTLFLVVYMLFSKGEWKGRKIM